MNYDPICALCMETHAFEGYVFTGICLILSSVTEYATHLLVLMNILASTFFEPLNILLNLCVEYIIIMA